MKKVAIIGGGLSGLTAAFYLARQNKNIDWQVYEASARFGGHIKTVHKQGYIIEKGPDSFLARKPAGMQLIHDLKLDSELVKNATGQSYIYQNKIFHPIPEGSIMGIPTKLKPFLKSKLFSPLGKVRVLYELIKPADRSKEDQSLGDFFEKRFGKEMVTHLIEPLFSGIYVGNLYQMSLRATYPAMETLLNENGSILKGLRKQRVQTTGTKQTIGAFRTLKGGMTQLVDELVKQLPAERCHLNKAIENIEKKEDRYHLLFKNGEIEVVDEIIFGINHLRALELMPQYESPLKNQKIASSATLSFGFKIDDVPSLPDGTGFLMTREKDEHMTACTWVHTKWPHMVPENRVLLRVFLGRSNLSNVTELADDELISLARTYLQDIMGVTAEPEVTEISKMNMAMPQYDIGHTERVASLLEKTRHQREGLHFIGMSYEGVGIPDCIQLAKETVKNM